MSGATVVGEHLERIPLGTLPREWRRGVNAATALRLRLGAGHVAPRRTDGGYAKVFVVGCGRSGTSWVQKIIGMDPGVITTQESHAYETVYGNVARRGSTSWQAWAKVLQRHDLAAREQRWVGLHWWVDRPELCALVGAAMHDREHASGTVAEDVIEGIFDTYFFGQGGTSANTLLEKTPGHLRFADLILRRYPDAKVVEVIRDGRDVCVSMQMQALTLRWPPRERAAQIQAWTNAVRTGMKLRTDPALADRVLLVRYEDLKADPVAEVTRLYEFCGFAAAPERVAEVVDATDFRHNQNTGAGRHTRRGEVGDWQNHFGADDEKLFREMASEVFEAAGYRF